MKLLVTSAFSVLVLSSTAMSQSQGDCVDQTASIVCSAKSNNGFCSSINYTSFAIPNFRNGTDDEEIDAELHTYATLYSSGCSNALVHLLCGYYKPPCFSGWDAEAIRLPPCRELCLYVRSSCEPVIKEFNAAASWPDHLDCDQFPLKGDENGTICFPNFYALEDYQTRLELPSSIAGFQGPNKVVTANRFWVPGPHCPQECSHKFCKKIDPNTVCSVPGASTAPWPTCTGTCHVTNCRACYYSKTVQTCPKHCMYGCGGNPSSRCFKRWSQCVKKGLKKNGRKRADNFKCVDPCKCPAADN